MKQFFARILDYFARMIAAHLAERLPLTFTQQVNDNTDKPSLAANVGGLNALMLNAALSSVPANVTPYKLFGGIDDATWYWLHTEGYRASPALREMLPGQPDPVYQLQCTGGAGDAALDQGLRISRIFKQLYEKYAGDFSACENVLDFGCGWGRIIRFYLRDIEPSRLWGTDVQEGIIEFCKRTNKWCNFMKNDAFPPTSFEADKFGMIFAYSVFSHLSEEACLKWLDEFHRIMKPGGILVVTTWGRDMITRCRDLRNKQNLPAWQSHLPGIFADTEQVLKNYDDGKFCFDSSADMYGAASQWLGEACIPRGYVQDRWSAQFESLEYIEYEPTCGQSVIVVKNRGQEIN